MTDDVDGRHDRDAAHPLRSRRCCPHLSRTNRAQRRARGFDRYLGAGRKEKTAQRAAAQVALPGLADRCRSRERRRAGYSGYVAVTWLHSIAGHRLEVPAKPRWTSVQPIAGTSQSRITNREMPRLAAQERCNGDGSDFSLGRSGVGFASTNGR